MLRLAISYILGFGCKSPGLLIRVQTNYDILILFLKHKFESYVSHLINTMLCLLLNKLGGLIF